MACAGAELPAHDKLTKQALAKLGNQIALMRHPDSWTSEGREGHQLRRREGETGSEFITRAMLTFRLRSQKAKDPALAMRYLAAFEKIVTAIQVLRSAERTP